MLLTTTPLLFLTCNQEPGSDQPTYVEFVPPHVSQESVTQPVVLPHVEAFYITPTPVPTPTPTPEPTPVPRDVVAQQPAVEPELSLPPELEEQARIVDAYLVGTPLAGQGPAMVAASARYGIDYRMLPAISLYESTWGRAACGYNPYGYASCGVTFSSWEEAHEVAARTLASYGGITLTKLQIWNRGNVNDPAGYDYAIKVIREMATIQ